MIIYIQTITKSFFFSFFSQTISTTISQVHVLFQVCMWFMYKLDMIGKYNIKPILTVCEGITGEY